MPKQTNKQTILFDINLSLIFRHVSKADILAHERKLMQVMEMILTKKKR